MISHAQQKRRPFALKAVLAAALTVTALLVTALAGCAQPTEADEPSLIGTWESMYDDGFTLVSDGSGNLTFTYYEYYSNPGTKTVIYAGTVVNSPNLSAAEGILIFQVTQTTPDTVYGPYPDVGNYFAVRWQNLSASGVFEAGPYKAWYTDTNGNYQWDDGEPTDQAIIDTLQGTATAAEAEAVFTVANGYFPATLSGEYGAK